MVTKVVVGDRIKAIRLEKGLSQAAFGQSVGLTRSGISLIESGGTYPSLDVLDQIVNKYSLKWDSLLGGSPAIKNPPEAVRTLVTTVDHTGKDTIVLVPVKAQAGYLVGSQQTEYIEHLPSFSVPGLGNGTYRAFEVSGYSMLADRTGFYPGDIVIGEYVEQLEAIKDGFVYILVSDAPEVDNIVLKRCLNYLDKGQLIICKSDNKDPQYPTFSIPAASVKEVWKFKIKLTRQAPEPSGLYERINHLEGDVQWLREQLRKRG
jgi:transcriptional regulator with XRE-family HTH domain